MPGRRDSDVVLPVLHDREFEGVVGIARDLRCERVRSRTTPGFVGFGTRLVSRTEGVGRSAVIGVLREGLIGLGPTERIPAFADLLVRLRLLFRARLFRARLFRVRRCCVRLGSGVSVWSLFDGLRPPPRDCRRLVVEAPIEPRRLLSGSRLEHRGVLDDHGVNDGGARGLELGNGFLGRHRQDSRLAGRRVRGLRSREGSGLGAADERSACGIEFKGAGSHRPDHERQTQELPLCVLFRAQVHADPAHEPQPHFIPGLDIRAGGDDVPAVEVHDPEFATDQGAHLSAMPEEGGEVGHLRHVVLGQLRNEIVQRRRMQNDFPQHLHQR